MEDGVMKTYAVDVKHIEVHRVVVRAKSQKEAKVKAALEVLESGNWNCCDSDDSECRGNVTEKIVSTEEE